jgi:CRISPR-associated endonuclease Csn1
MKKILGVDIGTNSIGWALINWDAQSFQGNIIDMGSRILPTDAELLSNYEKGLAASKNATRRQARGARRLLQRYKLRRQRLIDALQLLNWLPVGFNPGNQLPVSAESLKEMTAFFVTDKIPADWVVYYLRYKALTQKIELSELARVLYHMNQRRGFKSNRKANKEIIETENGLEEQEGRKKREKTVEMVIVTKVENTGEQIKGGTVYKVYLQDGRSGAILRRTPPDWQGEMELDITYVPASKKSTERYEFRLPDKNDWQKMKDALERDIDKVGLFPGEYFLKELQKNRAYRIKEKIIDRKYYEAEIRQIITTQLKFYPGLASTPLIGVIAEKFYPNNKYKQKELKNSGLEHLLLNDIIYYQRPLKSQKSSIADCRYEKKNYRNPDGKWQGIKVAPLSSPVFQEFRIWQTINNIKILQRESRDVDGRLILEADVSGQFIDQKGLERLFDLFDNREKISQKQILKQLGNLDEKKYLANFFRSDEEKELPGNETKSLLRKVLKRAGLEEHKVSSLLESDDTYPLLWHILYSLDQEAYIVSALKKKPFGFSESVAAAVAKAPAFKPQYASLSAKAMNKLLPLMRSGKYWNPAAILPQTMERLEKILTGEFDEGISIHTRELFQKLRFSDISAFQGLQTSMTAYAVYGIHSEKDKAFYDSPEQIKILDANELRNPIVTQVINETLKTIQDIWKTYGRPYEIHIELARELKKNASERAELTKFMADNTRENDRIAALLRELPGGNPNSLGDMEKLKLWEKQADEVAREAFRDIRFKRPSEPTKDEIQKYKLWCEQKHLSPYSGKVIPISELFTNSYQVDHIIPRSRYFDDSFDNKVIVESYLNDEKDNRTAYQYIKEGSVRGHDLFPLPMYEAHVSRYFFGKKKRLLLSAEVPEGFIQRQLNDTKYISRKLNELLSPIAENTSAPIIITTGAITNELKTRWGLGEKMKEAVRWRFERLETLTGKELVSYAEEIKNDRPTGRKILKLEGYEKRIDHRHHALDALVIACTTRSHIQYINTLNAQRKDHQLKQELSFLLDQSGKGQPGIYRFRLPWPGFVIDAVDSLESIIVSFKNRVHLFGKRKNTYVKYTFQPDGRLEKKWFDQKEKKSTYVRKPISSPMPFGIMNLHFECIDMAKALKNPEKICCPDLKAYIKSRLSDFNGDIKATVTFLKNDKPVVNYGRKLGSVDYFIESKQQKVELWKAFYIPTTIIDEKVREWVMQSITQAAGNLEKALVRFCELANIPDRNEALNMRINLLAKNIVATKKVNIGKDFTHDKIDGIPDRSLAKILHAHLETFQIDGKTGPEIAFEGEGRETLFKVLGKRIGKVSVYEIVGEKYPVNMKAVQSEGGTNLFMAIYEKIGESGVRECESIPLRDVLQAKAAGDGSFVEYKEGYKYFLLSPNDLVYLPDEGESVDELDWSKGRRKIAAKIYKLVSVNKGQAFFVPQTLSKAIIDKIEFGPLNKLEKALDGKRMVKQHCIKLKVNRLGHVSLA